MTGAVDIHLTRLAEVDAELRASREELTVVSRSPDVADEEFARLFDLVVGLVDIAEALAEETCR